VRRFSIVPVVWACVAGLVGSPSAAADSVVGNIAVIETDPTVLQPAKPFDLNGKTLTFAPKLGGGYTVSVGPLSFESALGSNLGLKDDSFISQPLPFAFPFFGVARTTAFIGSNGFLTFGAPSTLFHFNAGSGGDASNLGDPSTLLDVIGAGLPRIAVLWQDWNPEAGGGVFASSLADRLVVTWNAVPLFGSSTTATFQVVLFSSGVIQMSYQAVTTTPGGGYLTGLSPGASDPFLVTTVDLSQGAAGSISDLPELEPLAQVFGSHPSPLVHVTAVARRFYRSHGDAFDQLLMFTNFPNALGDAFAFEVTARQTVSGIGDFPVDASRFFGSAGRLQSFVHLNRLDLYPADPTTVFFGTNNTVAVIGQEAGHQWAAYVTFDDAGVCSDRLLGRDFAHWSFFLDSDASVMEGNKWQAAGNGTFTTVEATVRYSPLDQYLMGLRAPSEVPGFFFITNPTGASRTRGSSPELGVTVGGTRKNVTLAQILTCEGSRFPASGFSAVNPTATWKQAFILLIPGGTTAPSPDVTKMETIRDTWAGFFHAAVGGRGAVDTTIPAFVSLGLNLNQSLFGPGDMFDLAVSVANPGAETAGDVYFGFLLPPSAGPALGCGGGDAVVFLVQGFTGAVVTCLSTFTGIAPLFSAVTIPAGLPASVVPHFFSFVWPPDAPAGTYTVFIVLTGRGTLAVIGAGLATMTFTP
jgi:hypothetical protein